MEPRKYNYDDLFAVSDNFNEFMKLVRQHKLDEDLAQEYWVEMTTDFIDFNNK